MYVRVDLVHVHDCVVDGVHWHVQVLCLHLHLGPVRVQHTYLLPDVVALEPIKPEEPNQDLPNHGGLILALLVLLALPVLVLQVGDDHEDEPIAADAPGVRVEEAGRVDELLEDEGECSELRVDPQVLLDQLHRL